MLNIIYRRRSKQQQQQTQEAAPPPPPEEYVGTSVERKRGVVHSWSKDRSLTRLHRTYDVDVTSTLDDDDDSVSVASSVCSLLYSDNGEAEHDFHEHRTQVKQSPGISVCSSKRSVASSIFSFGSQRNLGRKSKRDHEKKAGYEALVDQGTRLCAPVAEISIGTSYGGVTNLDDILDSFARQHDPERSKILIPASNNNNHDDDLSAGSSVISRTRKKFANVLKKGRKGSSKRVACDDGESSSLRKDDLDSLLARYRGSASGASNNEPLEQIVCSSKKGSQSFWPRSLYNRHRAENAREGCHSSLPSSDEEEEEPVNTAGESHGYDCDTGSVAACAKLVDYKVLQRSELNKSASNSPSTRLPRDPSHRVKRKMPAIDPLDIDRLLNKSDSEEEVILFEQTNDDASTISSLTSGSSLTLSSSSPTSVTDDRFNSGKKKNLLAPSFGKHYSALPASRRLFKDSPEPPACVKASKVAYNIPSSMQVKSHCTISVLLVEPKRKIFEIVSVDIARGTPVGAVLEKAREGADDIHIKRQTYVGLCNNTETTLNLMLPILKFLPSVNDKQRNVERFLSKDEQMKREMERRLLVAVPKKATAPECIHIRSLLWKNPKLQTWWHNSLPLHRLGVA